LKADICLTFAFEGQPCMNKSFNYSYPLARQVFNNTQPDLWVKVQEAWEKENFEECIILLLSYLGIETQTGLKRYDLRHGSVTIYLELKEASLNITAPFLDISQGQKIPLLRQATQLNFEPLTITRIILKEEQLTFHFSAPYELCEPYKVFDVLKEICIHADNYDDAFIRRFKARRVVAPSVIPYPEDQAREAMAVFRIILNETQEAVNFLEQKRMHAYIWDVLILMLLRIDFVMTPQGHLRGRLEYYITEMLSAFDLSEKISKGKAVLKEFQQLKDADILEDLYQIQTLVPFKTLATPDTVRNRLSRALQQVEKEFQEGQYLACSLTAPFHILYLLYEHALDEENYKLIKDLLPSSSGKPFKEVAIHFRNGLKEILSGIQQLPVELPETENGHPYTPIMNPL
jgi:hypothetical protein